MSDTSNNATLTAVATPKAGQPIKALLQPWLGRFRWSPTEKQWAAEASAREPQPSIEFLLLKHRSTTTEQASRSMASLVSQWQKTPWRIVTAEVLSAQGLNRVIRKSKSDWFAVVDAGDELEADASFRLAQAIRSHPEWELIYTDEDTISSAGEHSQPSCKPDFSLDYVRSAPYVGRLLLIKKTLFSALGGFDTQDAAADEYAFILRAWEQLGSAGIGHIPEVLYHRHQASGNRLQACTTQRLQAYEQALVQHLRRLAIDAKVLPGPIMPSFRVRYELPRTPLVSIIIPTRNQLPYLQRCVESILAKTTYPAYEIIVVDNGSDEPQACAYLNSIAAQDCVKVLRYPDAFNFSAMNNRAMEQAQGELLVLLNNDTAVLQDNWLEELVSQGLRPGIGAVGPKLLFPTGIVQHAGVVLGMLGPAEHVFLGLASNQPGYIGRAVLPQNYSAVTGACLLISKALYKQVGGLDEQAFQVAYNDIDLCLKVCAAGLAIVWTPWTSLLHEGSASQRANTELKPTIEKQLRLGAEVEQFYKRYMPKLAFDPAYNRHLSLGSLAPTLEKEAGLCWDPDWRPRPRVLAYPYDRYGSGEYRVLAPMRALRNAGLVQGWASRRILDPAEMARFVPDSLVLQKPVDDIQLHALVQQSRLAKAFNIFELDDLLTNLPLKNPHREHIHADIAYRIQTAAGFCDRLLVTTEPLAQAFKGLTDEVCVQPNYIERAAWGHLVPKRREGSKPRVGWAGGGGHLGDLELLIEVVSELADEVEWVLLGACPAALAPFMKEVHPGVALVDYPAKLASLDLDLAVAPLEHNEFNDAKSNLRLLEYGALGFPVVCSDITPYQGDMPVWRVTNTPDNWVKTIREVVADRAALAQAGDVLRRHILANWVLEEHLDEWLKAWLP